MKGNRPDPMAKTPLPNHKFVVSGDLLNQFIQALRPAQLVSVSKSNGFGSPEELIASLSSRALFQGWTDDSVKGHLASLHKVVEESDIEAFFDWFGEFGGDFDIEPMAAEFFAMVEDAFETFLESGWKSECGTVIAIPQSEISGKEAPV